MSKPRVDAVNIFVEVHITKMKPETQFHKRNLKFNPGSVTIFIKFDFEIK
jgi:hypothetical protein